MINNPLLGIVNAYLYFINCLYIAITNIYIYICKNISQNLQCWNFVLKILHLNYDVINISILYIKRWNLIKEICMQHLLLYLP